MNPDQNKIETGANQVNPAQNRVIEKQVPTVEELKSAYDRGDKSFVMNQLAKNIDAYPAGSLPKEMVDALADFEHGGGSPKTALYNADKFEGLTAQEMAMKLIAGDQSSPLFSIEEDLKNGKQVLVQATELLDRKRSEGFSDGDESVEKLKAQIAEISREVYKIEGVIKSINKPELLEVAVKKPNFLMPERMHFFTKGEQSMYIKYDDLINKMLNAGYSPSYLRVFVEQAQDGSLSKDLANKLEAKGGILSGVSEALHSKFVNE